MIFAEEKLKYTYIHIHSMSTKTISITTEAYERLKIRKKANESFTEVINRITGKESIASHAGFLSKKSADNLEKSIKNLRKRSNSRLEKIESELS